MHIGHYRDGPLLDPPPSLGDVHFRPCEQSVGRRFRPKASEGSTVQEETETERARQKDVAVRLALQAIMTKLKLGHIWITGWKDTPGEYTSQTSFPQIRSYLRA